MRSKLWHCSSVRERQSFEASSEISLRARSAWYWWYQFHGRDERDAHLLFFAVTESGTKLTSLPGAGVRIILNSGERVQGPESKSAPVEFSGLRSASSIIGVGGHQS